MQWTYKQKRCHWVNLNNQLYINYHDQEWGKAIHEDQILFEMLLLECFQAGLSWECILNKREGFRKAFDSFNLDKICNYDSQKIIELQNNPEIIRNRLKIQAAVNNANVFRNIQMQWSSFSNYLWHWTENQVIYETGKTQSDLSNQISKDLKKKGMKFVGSTTIYAYLQAVGVINSHEKDCFLFFDKTSK